MVKFIPRKVMQEVFIAQLKLQVRANGSCGDLMLIQQQMLVMHLLILLGTLKEAEI